jgi:hypothetical protein
LVTFDIAADDLRLLAEIGFLGLGRARPAEAEAIFTLLRRMRPDQEAGHVGGALAALAQGQTDRAAQLLRAAPQTEAVLAFRAVVLGQAGDQRMVDSLREDLGFMRATPAILAIAGGPTGAQGSGRD